jgi:hypothetical protein
MRTTRPLPQLILILTMVSTLSLVLACSSEQDMPTQISGTWQRSEGTGTVEIDLVQEPPLLKIDGKAYPTTIAKIDKGAQSVHLNVTADNGQPEVWILHQQWNDNGSTFTLSLIHNGTHEKLVNKKQS